MVYVEECFFCNAWSAIDKNQTCKKLRMLHFLDFLFWWLSQSTASLLYEWHLSELTNAITFLVGEQLQLVATATIGAASESLSCTFPSWSQLRIFILMHLDLSLCISISVHLNLICVTPSWCISISVAHLHLNLSCASPSWCIWISVAQLHLDLSCASSSQWILDLSCKSPSWCI